MEFDWQTLGSFGIYVLAGLLCLLGFVLSCLSLSGTWLVLAAGGLLAWMRWPGFPGVATLAVLLLVCIGVEAAEALAGAWGVKKRGGTKAAGWAALLGGFAGMILGTAIPVPFIGSLIGMLAGSFACAYVVEHARMKKADHAAHVATGAVIARLAIIFIKIAATGVMILVLALGTAFSS
jgi:uncharacterized protein YqgC (DUF456 family)